MCVRQVLGRGPQEPVSYERGRLMPLFRGATSKIILAHLPARTLKSLFEQNAAEIAQDGLGKSLEQFRSSLAAIPPRRCGGDSRRRIDPGRGRRRRRRCSIGTAISWAASVSRCRPVAPTARSSGGLTPLLMTGAREIERP